jgi:putative sterol carrier protein
LETYVNKIRAADERKMNIKTPREFFEKTLPEKFEPVKAGNLNAVIQMNLTGPNAGDWTIAVKDQKMEIKEGNDLSPGISVKMADTDFVDLINGKLNAVSAFMSGKIQFKGSMSLALKLIDLGIL